MRTFYLSYSWGLVYYSSDDPSTCTAAVAHVVLQGMELYIPSTVSGKLSEQGPRNLRSIHQELISFGRSQRRHLVNLASLCFHYYAQEITRKILVHTLKQKTNLLGSLSLELDFGFRFRFRGSRV